MEKERFERERLEKLENERLEREQLEREENERLERERLEKLEREENERFERERLEKLQNDNIKEMTIDQLKTENEEKSDSFSMNDFDEIEEDLDQLGSDPSDSIFIPEIDIVKGTESMPHANPRVETVNISNEESIKEIKEEPKEEKKIRKGGIRGLRELKKLKQKEQNLEQNIEPKKEEIKEKCLLTKTFIEKNISDALHEHFMTEDQIGEFLSGTDFSYMKYFTLFQELINENYVFIWDSNFTEKIVDSLRIDKFIEKSVIEEFEDRFDKLSESNLRSDLGNHLIN
jgi:hypothetical protein